jgi:hypothetical protein
MMSARALSLFVMAIVTLGVTTCRAMGPLHEAAAAGNTEFVKGWISKKHNLDVTYDEPSRGIEGNYARARGVTALMTAARTGQLEVAKLLAEAGANLYAESTWPGGEHPRNAFDYAVEAGRIEVAEYLWGKADAARFARRLALHITASCSQRCDDKFGTDARSNLALFLIGITRDEAVLGKGISEAACLARRPLEVLAFLEKYLQRFPKNTLHCISYQTMGRHRPLQERIAIASFFLQHGADPNDLFNNYYTPLMGAAAAHDLEMVRFLLERGADPNARNADGLTAIAAAANSCTYGEDAAALEPKQKAQMAVVEYLAQAGAKPSQGAPSASVILRSCCTRKPQTLTQRRTCEVFGL